jgi:hypothetical protein
MEIMGVLSLVACCDVSLGKFFFFLDCLTLTMEVLYFFKMLGYTHPVTQHSISEDIILIQYHCDYLRLHLQLIPTGEEG